MTIVLDQEAYERACNLAKGSYQHGVVSGHESLSGSSLKGKAKNYGGTYARSRASLLANLREAGVPFFEITVDRGRRVLVFGRKDASGWTLIDRAARKVEGLGETKRWALLVTDQRADPKALTAWCAANLAKDAWKREGMIFSFDNEADATMLRLAHS